MIDLNPAPPSTATPHKATLVVVVLLICAAAFAGGMFVTDLWGMFMEERELAGSGQVIGEEKERIIKDEQDTEDQISTQMELVIDWIDPFLQPTLVVDSTVLGSLCSYFMDSESSGLQGLCGEPPQINQVRLGTVIDGVYAGRSLEMITARVEGLGFSHRSIYLLVDPLGEAQPVLLDQIGLSVGENYSVLDFMSAFELIGWNGASVEQALVGFTIDRTANIPALIPQQQLQDDGNIFHFTGKWVRFDTDIASSVLIGSKTVHISDGVTTEGGLTLTLYEPQEGASTSVGRNQYYLIDEDGRILWYDLAIPFFEYERDGEGNPILTQGVPSVVWNDGGTNTQTYMKGAMGGCGFTTSTNVISEDTVETLGLSQVGSAGGTPIFEPLNYEGEYYADAFNIVTFETPEEAVKSYQDFTHPYIYFQDVYGRWVELTSIEIVPPVECGKPVIYLYPESVMDMSVWVNPAGGFSYTEPEYDDGWDVTAYPNGRIINRADGLEYPYLFWEGRGSVYSAPTMYWVVEQTSVESFLRTTLESMNFNQSEIADFVEFWLPRMQEDAYYKIGFHGTNVMNELAPLSLSVKPDHVFRVLMDYEGLDTWQPSKPPARLPRANRNGFEVMEWGGVLR